MKGFFNTVFLLFLFNQLLWSQGDEIIPSFKIKVEEAAKELEAIPPIALDPQSLNAIVIWSEDSTQLAVVMKASLLATWYSYAYVPPGQPFIATEMILELPGGIKALGKWEKPPIFPSQKGIFIYEGELIFKRFFTVDELSVGDRIICGLYYQTCDPYKCLPPKEKVKELFLKE